MKEGVGFTKVYPDRVIPVAIGPIRMREDRTRPLLNTAEMCREIAVGETVWGVATWEHLDPQIKQFSVYVQGLTNAYRWKDEPGEYKAGDPLGRDADCEKNVEVELLAARGRVSRTQRANPLRDAGRA